MFDGTQPTGLGESETNTAATRRARRAREEEMVVSLRRAGGMYDVHSGSGNTYRVDIAAEECSCPDWTEREPEGGCKHLRRVRLEVQAGRVPTPDGRLPADRVTATESEALPILVRSPFISFDWSQKEPGAVVAWAKIMA